jgi:hypothetical protein
MIKGSGMEMLTVHQWWMLPAMLTGQTARQQHGSQEGVRDVRGLYCKGGWDFTRIRAYQLIGSVAVRKNLLTQVNIEPKSEKQILPLAKPEPAKQVIA